MCFVPWNTATRHNETIQSKYTQQKSSLNWLQRKTLIKTKETVKNCSERHKDTEKIDSTSESR